MRRVAIASSFSQPMIARIWRGRTKAQKADEYAAYLSEYGFKPLVAKAFGAQMFREDRAGEIEFVPISPSRQCRDSLAKIRGVFITCRATRSI